jgi:uncharacterized RDD family membrane protein YckC
MRDHDVALAVLLLALASATEPRGEKRPGVVSRFASRATEKVVDVVDPDVVIEHVDINAIIERVDVNALLERVDVDALVDRIDIERLMARVDIDAIIEQVDVKDIVDRAGVADIVKESTGELAGSALDVFRRQIVALDAIISRTTYRLIGRDPTERPLAPENLESEQVEVAEKSGRAQVTGHYAGPLNRLTAFIIDVVAVWASFVLAFAGIFFIVELFVRTDLESMRGREAGAVALLLLALWAFIYLWVGLALAGRTLGMALVGLRVVTRQGAPVTGRQALVRTLVYPFSFLIFGLGFLGIFTSPERRSMHDAAAGTTVVYDWGDRPAEMPAPLTRWVTQHAEEDEGEQRA